MYEIGVLGTGDGRADYQLENWLSWGMKSW